ncbi:N-acetylneuraminate synthase [Piscinibacter terrae]|uniref:N-acetylneuraminate synthase n=1 Tax=Piscinibacter terrae TaxID=2496871 RepID=A0A3N7HHU3_9BURK|nr:N-acetylneuraminate synthase [Albitalea terrae]RQP21624.1 N-acetylneuraminate synthase [Albitalea terrae]
MPKRTLFIAEAGVNHNGSLSQALALVDVAADAGADVVKFQTFKATNLVTASARKADYQVSNTGEAGGQLEMLRRLELSPADHLALLQRCRERGIRFMSTAFDPQSLDFLATLDMPAIKIPSGDITHAPMALQAARLRRPLIVSTGMSTLADIEAMLGVLAFGLTCQSAPSGRRDFDAARCSPQGEAALREFVTLLHCTTQYPAPPEAVNLLAMDTMAQAFNLPVGYSDHTIGIEVSIAAVARGATVIEKHFTLDRALPGPDHAASLEPSELKQLVAAIRVVERALGSRTKAPAPAELDNRSVARRSIVAARPLSRGEVLTLDSLAFKRPGTGLPPLECWDLIGKPAARDYAEDDLILP